MLQVVGLFTKFDFVIFWVKIGKIFFLKENIFSCKKITDAGLEKISESLKGPAFLQSAALDFRG